MFYSEIRYANPEKTMIHATHDDGRIVVVEPAMGELWAACLSGSLGKVLQYKKPPEPSAKERLAALRGSMHCSTAQLGLALVDAKILGDFESALDERGQIIWRKAAQIRRRGPILDALKSIMTEKEIDALFSAASEIKI